MVVPVHCAEVDAVADADADVDAVVEVISVV